MKPSPPLAILLVALASIAGLVSLVVYENGARESGTEVVLAMEAVDPRALLTGHYVRVSLQETLPPPAPGAANAGCPPATGPAYRSGGELFGRSKTERWIALAPRGGRHVVAGAAALRNRAAAYGPVQVRGEVACTPGRPAGGQDEASPTVVSLDLGPDRFHVNQAQAERIDKLLAARRPGERSPVDAIVSVGQDGKARLKGLIVEGKRLELSLF